MKGELVARLDAMCLEGVHHRVHAEHSVRLAFLQSFRCESSPGSLLSRLLSYVSFYLGQCIRFSSRRLFVIVLLALTLPVAACTDAPSQAEIKKARKITDFHEIPGITKQEIAAIQELAASRASFSGAVMVGSDCFYANDGHLQGFSILTYAWLSEIFKIPFTPVVTQWDALLTGLESVAYDFSVDIPTNWKSDERYHVTDATVEKATRLYVSPLLNRAMLQQKYSPPRYGYLDLRGKQERISAYIDRPIVLVPVSSLVVAQSMLLSGELDAFVDSETAETVIKKYSSIESIPSLSYSTVSLATCNPELAPVVSAVQKCLTAGGGFYLNQLQTQGSYQYLRHKLQERLTDEERDFLKTHQRPDAAIRTGIDYDNYPYSFYNEQEKAWQGIAVDLLAEMHKITGLHFTFANSSTTDWPTLRAMLKDGRLSMTTELIRTPERKGSFLWSSTPYLADAYALLSMTELPDLNVSQIPLARVGLISGTAYAEAFQEMFPNHKHITYYNNKIEALDALERGDVDLLMMTRSLLLSASNYLERTGYKINLKFKRLYESYFGFNNNEAVLCSIISKSLLLLDTRTVSESWIRKVFDYRGALARVQVPYLFAVSGILLLVLALLFLMYRTKTKRLAEAIRKKSRELRERTLLAYTDALTGIYNRSKFDKELLLYCEQGESFCILLLDIDHFKAINDTHGHLVGDIVLSGVAEVVLKNIRSQDVFARWGGEEFVLLRTKNPAKGTDLAERLRRGLETQEFDTVGHITVSLGIAAYRPEDTPTTLLQRVDEALYAAKEAGRNTIRFL